MTDEDEVRQVEGCRGGGGRGDNGRDRQVGVGWGREGEREERHGSQSAHTVKAGRSVPCPSETLAQSPELLCTWKGGGRRLNAFLYSSLSPASLPLILPLARYTLNTEYLSTKTKQKKQNSNVRATVSYIVT